LECIKGAEVARRRDSTRRTSPDAALQRMTLLRNPRAPLRCGHGDNPPNQPRPQQRGTASARGFKPPPRHPMRTSSNTRGRPACIPPSVSLGGGPCVLAPRRAHGRPRLTPAAAGQYQRAWVQAPAPSPHARNAAAPAGAPRGVSRARALVGLPRSARNAPCRYLRVCNRRAVLAHPVLPTLWTRRRPHQTSHARSIGALPARMGSSPRPVAPRAQRSSTRARPTRAFHRVCRVRRRLWVAPQCAHERPHAQRAMTVPARTQSSHGSRATRAVHLVEKATRPCRALERHPAAIRNTCRRAQPI